MHIEITGDDSITRQPRIYAEYRLFAALSEVVDTDRVQTASMVLRRRFNRHCDGVVCTARVELDGHEVVRVSAWGPHPYAAINRAIERLRMSTWRPNHSRQHRDTHSIDGHGRTHRHEHTDTETHGTGPSRVRGDARPERHALASTAAVGD
jgi:ribosome-associated translation inhibitor RaiA